MSYFGATGTPCFGFLVMSHLNLKARVDYIIHIAEANVMYIP